MNKVTKCVQDFKQYGSLEMEEFIEKNFKIILVRCGGHSGLLHENSPRPITMEDTVQIISLEDKYNFMQDKNGSTSFFNFGEAIRTLIHDRYEIFGFEYLEDLVTFLKEGR